MMGVFVEGPTDEKVVAEVASDLGIPADVQSVGGGFDAAKINRYRDHHGHDSALVLRDTECGRPDERYRQLRSAGKIAALEGDAEVCFAECAIEAWLLADASALGTVLDQDVDPPPDPERLRDPKRKLRQLFRDARGFSSGYNGPKHAPDIAAAMDVDTVAERCESFAETRETMEALA